MTETYKGWEFHIWFLLGYGWHGYAENVTGITHLRRGYDSEEQAVAQLKKQIDQWIAERM